MTHQPSPPTGTITAQATIRAASGWRREKLAPEKLDQSPWPAITTPPIVPPWLTTGVKRSPGGVPPPAGPLVPRPGTGASPGGPEEPPPDLRQQLATCYPAFCLKKKN